MTVTRLVRISRQRIRSLFRRRLVDEEMDREIGLHLEYLIDEHRQQGLSTDAARRQAQRLFGNVTLLKEQTREQRRVQMVDDIRRDVAFAWSMIRRRPAITFAAALSLAVAIGANAGIVAFADAALRAPLPIAQGDRLVTVGTFDTTAAIPPGSASLTDFFQWRDRTTSFDDVEATFGGDRDFSGDASGLPAERFSTRAVTPGWFPLLGVPPLMGRWIDVQDVTSAAAARVMVISYRLWQHRYGSDPNIVGRVVKVNGVATTIAGVMPSDFLYQDRRTEAWFPLALVPPFIGGDAKLFQVIARLGPGVTIDGAERELNEGRPAELGPTGARAAVSSFRHALYGWATAPVLGIAAAAWLLLITTCANLSVVALAQCEARRREIGMRLALGAGHGRVIRQWLTENVLLVTGAGVLALGLTWWTLRIFAATVSPPLGSPQLRPVAMTGLAVAAVVIISAGVALVLTLAPVWFIRRVEPWNVVRSGGRASSTTRRPRAAQAILLTAQVASACALIFVGGLLARSYGRATGRDLNIDTRGLATFEFRAPVPDPVAAFGRMIGALRALPGVTDVAGISDAPVNSLVVPEITVTARPDLSVDAPATTLKVKSFIVTPRIFASLRASLAMGRDIDEQDTHTAPWVVVVNERAAEMLWPRKGSGGGYLTIQGSDDERPRAVVGIVRNIPLARREIDPKPIIYTSYLQQVPKPIKPVGDQARRMEFVVRYTGDAPVLEELAQHAAAAISPDIPLVPGGPPGAVGILLFEFLRYAVVILILGGLTGVLAAFGLSGTLARRVDEVTVEIGIRRALGSNEFALVAVLCRAHFFIVLAGLSIGLSIGIVTGYVVRSQLWRVGPADPLTLLVTTGLMLGVVFVACLGPMRRAFSEGPAAALRHD